ncbi:methionyl-tRNA formyltransferase [Lampropedia cohaerens]|uniref:Methionyl-tRNA formyltransferase n=1 Tax=Lampropedia cohaerens TaxID=1610491 RepID=A0A0U1PWX6_9BURK|nr:methionyl-tRNA formyltransferase [Lampropedia cohaerens]KKW67038.1 methionyl-tRNA formyltransferase [Lampropedia cohaerens]
MPTFADNTPRIAFAGTPAFAEAALAEMIAQGFAPQLVLTQPDRPAGRGLKPQPSPVKQRAISHGIAVLQPEGLRLDGRHALQAQATRDALKRLAPDVLVVAAYGLILPAWLLELPRYGCLNIHASLLPRWRGAAPIHRAIEAGDRQTGITIMQMDEGLDTGAIVARHPLDIADDDTTATLHDRLAHLGANAIVDALKALQHGPLPSTAQPEDGVTYAEKISRAESRLDLRQPAHRLALRIRAFNPYPGAQLTLLREDAAQQAETLKVWHAQAIASAAPGAAAPGTVIAADRQAGIVVACADGSALRLLQLQRPGGKRLDAGQLLNGFAIAPGDRFALPMADAATPPDHP